jgi:hypothetical protein
VTRLPLRERRLGSRGGGSDSLTGISDEGCLVFVVAEQQKQSLKGRLCGEMLQQLIDFPGIIQLALHKAQQISGGNWLHACLLLLSGSAVRRTGVTKPATA